MKKRIQASKEHVVALHLGASIIIASLIAFVVFFLWYPYPFRQLSEGTEIFLLVLFVDIALGPTLTFFTYNPNKSQLEKLLDFTIIIALQLGSLAYGLFTIFQARPIYVVFEYDRFRIVHASEVPKELLGYSQEIFKKFPLNGPKFISLRPMNTTEKYNMTLAALEGLPLSARPELWQSFTAGREAILKAAMPANYLLTKFPTQSNEIKNFFREKRQSIDDNLYLPIISKKNNVWTIIFSKQEAQIIGYLPLDSF